MIWLAVFATVTFVLSRLAWWPAARHQAKGPKPTVRVAASFLVVVLAAGAEPVMHTAIYAYDAPAVARIDVGTSGDVESGSAQFVGMRERPVSPEGRSTTFLTRKNATKSAPIESGNYVVSTPRGEYVGQSGNISNRLDQHVASGKFTQAEVDAAQRISVPGSRLDREIAEQLLIDSKGGVPNLINVVNPIGPKRFGVMPNQPYVR